MGKNEREGGSSQALRMGGVDKGSGRRKRQAKMGRATHEHEDWLHLLPNLTAVTGTFKL